MTDCFCRSPECWDREDFTWLSGNSGWRGQLHGTDAAVFFVHGKKIKEQRHIPTGSFPISDLPRLIERWAKGLPNARLEWSTDTGGGDAGLWIEGVRDPTPADWGRLAEARDRMKAKAASDLKFALSQFPDLREALL